MIGIFDESAQKLNLNQFNLMFLEKKIEKEYEIDKKAISIKYSKILYVVMIIVFYSYIFGNFLNIEANTKRNSIEIILIFLGFIFFRFYTRQNMKNIIINV